MLILRLMGHCNSRCRFCCVREELARSEDIPLDRLKERILQHPPDLPIDFFGGEPTLYPHFLEALSFARSRGHSCTVATNARRFSNRDFAQKVAALGPRQIRTSIYGHDANIHDAHTGVRGSFSQTVGGIKNIIELGTELYVNILITSANYETLVEIVDLLHTLGVLNVKFSSLTGVESCLDLVPDPREVRPFLAEAIRNCEHLNIDYAIEKSPLCLVPEYYTACCYEPDHFLFRYPTACSTCAARDYCVGVPKEQLALYGENLVTPFSETKLTASNLPEKIIISQEHFFVSWDDDLLPALTVLIKVVEGCNLTCDYCYAARNFHRSKAITQEMIGMLFSQLAQTQFDRIDINWHGGEPLLVGIPFLATALESQKNSHLNGRRTVVSRIQTNGTLVSDQWVEFFEASGLDVGVSIDGDREMHDLHRTYHTGRGSFDDVIAAIHKLAIKHISTELIMVVTPEVAGRAQETYRFFSTLAQANHEVIESVNFLPSFEVTDDKVLLSSTIAPSDFAAFMISLFDEWFADDNPSLHIAFFEDVISVFLGGTASLCFFKRGCSSFITVEPDGGVYPCDRFAGISEFYLGSIQTNGLQEILASERFAAMTKAFQTYPEHCLTCDWVKLCRGGCSYQAYGLTGRVDDQTYYCDSLQRIFAHIDNTLSTNVENYSRYIGSGRA